MGSRGSHGFQDPGSSCIPPIPQLCSHPLCSAGSLAEELCISSLSLYPSSMAALQPLG